MENEKAELAFPPPRLKRNSTKKKLTFGRALIRLMIIIALGYVAIIVMMMANETYLIFPGSKFPKGDWETTQFEFEEINFESADGTRLVGWFLPRPDRVGSAEEPSTFETVLFCHGNAENAAQASWSGNEFRNKLNADVLVFDYRGFGKSEGSPNEPGVLADSEAALEWLCDRTDRTPEEVIVVGRSLGGGPAVHLAAKCGCKTLVLQRTFSSIADTAQHHYRWLPVRLLMRNPFLSIEKIKSCEIPLFQSHGDVDTVVPIQLGRKLHDASPANRKKFLECPGMGHFDGLPTEYWSELKSFLEELPPAADNGTID